MTIKEVINKNEKINNYISEGKLSITLASELDNEYNVEHEKVELIKTMRQVLENNKKIESRLSKIIGLFENLQKQVDSIEI